ncbi:MAG: GAF domain-containing protein [Clostridia bacterium]|nr:GAF domain-containing protein [Clostridia bacterium]
MEQDFTKRAQALISGVPYLTANLANLSALIWEELDRINWAGFYLMNDGALVLGPFQGRPACIRIEIGKGVCGTAVREDAVQRVDDVHLFPGHIACDEASRSELVIPIHAGGQVIGVLDIDSPEYGRFDEKTRQELEEFVRMMEQELALQFLELIDDEGVFAV